MTELWVVKFRDRYTFLLKEGAQGMPEPFWDADTYATKEEAQEAGERVIRRLNALSLLELGQPH